MEAVSIMSARNTPGPWTVEPPSMGFTQITGPNGELIFGLASGLPEEKQHDDICESNAKLIEAAPDLLAALQLMALRCHPCRGSGRLKLMSTIYEPAKPQPCANCIEARVAIAKATK